MIIITDSHVSSANGNVDAFFEMLQRVADSGEDVVFLGDIFDLWISLPRYEEPIQKRFLQWCHQLCKSRMIGFVEGNHEFYVTLRNRNCFTWSSGSGHQLGDTLFVHGDLINRKDRNYLRWRLISKNLLMRTIVRLLPGGPGLAHKTKAKMKKTNQSYKIAMPIEALKAYAESCAAQGLKRVFVGHFHENYQVDGDSCRLTVLPDWFGSGEITRFETHKKQIETGPWRQILQEKAPA